MDGLQLTVVPVGKMPVEDLEAALSRAARVLKRPIELREPLPAPHGSEDPGRGQHRAAVFMSRLRAEVAKLKPGRLVGADDPAAKPPLKPQALLFVTDLDLYTARTEGVLGALMPGERCAVVSVRRLREAFYRRKADPGKQRARLIKELLRMAGRLAGLPECSDLQCALAPSRGTPDLDIKEERFCRACEQRLFEGKLTL